MAKPTCPGGPFMKSVRAPFDGILAGLALLCAAGAAHAQTTITTSPQTISFVYQIGGSIPGPQSIQVTAQTPSQWVASVTGAPWLSLSPTSGFTPSTIVATFTPQANMTPGTQSGVILIGPPTSPDSVKTVV